jgi:hypothetical protein
MLEIIVITVRSAVFSQILHHFRLPTGATSLRAPPDPGRGHTADPPRE